MYPQDIVAAVEIRLVVDTNPIDANSATSEV